MPTPGALVFFGLATLILGCAGGVAFSRNILYSAFLLLGTLAGTAGLYLYIGADFVGIAQILIYVGGILVLILFAVLLTNKIGEVKLSNASMGVAAAVPMALLIVGVMSWLAIKTPWPETEAVATPTTLRLGDAFLREYLLQFELASVILLMALVGAMVIARRAVKEELSSPIPEEQRLV
jgi:NADH-quinone oxidoreductase subunit J